MRASLIIVFLAIGFIASSVVAGSLWFQLDSRNLDSQPLTFKIKTEKTPQGTVQFYVDVESRKAVLTENLSASLTVVHKKQLITRVDLARVKYATGMRYVFEVAPKYLTESKFAFKDHGGPNNSWINDVYWFYLKDFTNEKETTNRVTK